MYFGTRPLPRKRCRPFRRLDGGFFATIAREWLKDR
jgi:hypothetical protein